MNMNYKIGDTVKIIMNISKKWNRIANCDITNKYIKNNTTYYSVKEINGIYRCSNIKKNRFIS